MQWLLVGVVLAFGTARPAQACIREEATCAVVEDATVRQLLADAASDDATKLKGVGTALRDKTTLAQLEKIDCAVTQILITLAQNDHAQAELAAIATSKPWKFSAKTSARAKALLAASAETSDPPEAIVALWKQLATKRGEWPERVVRALVTSSSKPAIDLLAKLIASSKYGEATRIDWLQTYYLPNRVNPKLLGMAGTLLPTLPQTMRLALVDATFGEALGTCGASSPGYAYEQASMQAFRALGDVARKKPLPQKQDDEITHYLSILARIETGNIE